MNIDNCKICIIGMGYVGAPLAVEFGRKRKVIGYDINKDRINSLSINQDSTLELSSEDLSDAIYLNFTSNVDDIKNCGVYIITVPTPINQNKTPDLSPLIVTVPPGDTFISSPASATGGSFSLFLNILPNC